MNEAIRFNPFEGRDMHFDLTAERLIDYEPARLNAKYGREARLLCATLVELMESDGVAGEGTIDGLPVQVAEAGYYDEGVLIRRSIKRTLGDRKSEIRQSFAISKDVESEGAVVLSRNFMVVERTEGHVGVAQGFVAPGMQQARWLRGTTFADDYNGITLFDIDYLYDEIIALGELCK